MIDAIDTIGLVDDIDMIDSFITIIFDTKKPGLFARALGG